LDKTRKLLDYIDRDSPSLIVLCTAKAAAEPHSADLIPAAGNDRATKELL
jgi:hypothetical protein